MSTVLSEFMELLVGGIVTLAEGIAAGIIAMVKALFLETATVEGVETVTGLSVFGGVLAIFCAIGLAVGVTSKVFIWITNLGK